MILTTRTVLIGGRISIGQHPKNPFWTIDTLFYQRYLETLTPNTYIIYLKPLLMSYNEATGVS